MFHVSIDRGEKTWQAFPRIPERRHKSGAEDSTTARICVAPTVEQCLLAIDGISSLKYSGIRLAESWLIYTTDAIAYSAEGFVPDFSRTEEHWIIEPCWFTLVGEVYRNEKGNIVSLINGNLSTLYKNEERK